MAKVTSIRNAHSKIYISITALVLLLSLVVTILPAHELAASDDAVKWTKVNIPTEGKAGNWVLADDSDVQHLTIGGDGTLYAYGKGLDYTLYQSKDGGYTWSHIGNVKDDIVGIAISPHDKYHILRNIIT